MLISVLEWIVYFCCAVGVLSSLPIFWITMGFFRRAPHLVERERELLKSASDLRRREAELPHVLIQIPTFNEPNVIARSLESAAALEWPKDKLHIQILDDSTDETAKIARRLADRIGAEGIDIDVIHRDNREGYKAGALKNGLAAGDWPFVAIFDADFAAPADWLMNSMAALQADAGLAFVQTRIDFANRRQNWKTRGQSIYLDSFYVDEQGAMYLRGDSVPFNGTGALWRRQAIIGSGNWSGVTITEDFELSIRVFDQGWRSRCLLSVACEGELPDRLGPWIEQQGRWITGIAQTIRRNIANLARRRGARFSRATLWFRGLKLLTLPFTFAGLVGSLLMLALSGAPRYAYLFMSTLVFVYTTNMALPALATEHVIDRRTPVRLIIDLAYAFVLLCWLAVHSYGFILKGLFGPQEREFVRTPKRGTGA